MTQRQTKTAREYLANYLADLHYHQNAVDTRTEECGRCDILEAFNAFTCGTPEFATVPQFDAYVEGVEAALASITGPDDEEYYNYYEDPVTKAPTLPSVMDLLRSLASELGVTIIEGAGGHGYWIYGAPSAGGCGSDPHSLNTFTALREGGYCLTKVDLQEQLLYLRSLQSG